MSSVSDRVEAEVARAKRTFRQSRSIIVAARNELDSYGRWLDRHRVTWAEEAKRHRRLFNRKMAVKAFTRFAVAPFALAHRSQAEPQGRTVTHIVAIEFC